LRLNRESQELKPDVVNATYGTAEAVPLQNEFARSNPAPASAAEIVWKFTRDTGHEHPQLRDAIGSYEGLLRQMGNSEQQVLARMREIAAKYGFSLGDE